MTPSSSTDDTACERSQNRVRESNAVDVGPFTARWELVREAEATFVTVRVRNDHPRARVVRIENRLDGDVRPPRRHGVPAEGWDADGVTRSVPGEGTVSVGYVCHAPPTEPPITVRDDPADAEAATSPVETALRSLGDHAPPRAAVSSRLASPESPVVSATPDDCATDTEAPVSTTRPPETVTAWFRAVEARLDTADRLGGDVRTATPVVASLGGRRGVATLESTLETDARALHAVADRARTLATRIEETDVPDLGDDA